MEGRARIRRFLQGDEADRAPFLPLATDFTARLAQRTRAELFSDPHALTQAFMEAMEVCRFDAAVLTLDPEDLVEAVSGADPSSRDVLAVLKESLQRLRTLLGDRAGVVVAVPGPRALAASLERGMGLDDLDELGVRLVEIVRFLEPQVLDALVVLEADALAEEDVDDLGLSLEALWNLGRYYSIASVFIAAEAGRRVVAIGSSAIAVWQGVEPAELLADGATRVGVPTLVDGSRSLEPLPAGGFYTSRGQIPTDADIASVQNLVRRAVGEE